jgi:hypothetical protein
MLFSNTECGVTQSVEHPMKRMALIITTPSPVAKMPTHFLELMTEQTNRWR